MNKKERIKELLQQIKLKEGESFIYNEERILAEYKNNEDNKSSIVIKVLSVLGGFFATLAFVGFLFITGFFRSEVAMLIMGILFVVFAIWINKVYDKLIIDTSSIAAYIVGFSMIVASLAEMNVNANLIIGIVLLIALIALFITQNYMLSFMSILAVNGSLLAFIVNNGSENIVHLYIVLQTILIVAVFLYESKMITLSNKMSRLYNPLRIALIVSFLTGLAATSKKQMLSLSDNYYWISAVVIALAILYLIPKILNKLAVTEMNLKITIYILVLLLLGFTSGSPAILGGILMLLLSFYTDYKIGLVIGIVALIYFVSQYYYDLSFTLLTKSIMLFSSGILFIILYLFTNKKFTTNEEI